MTIGDGMLALAIAAVAIAFMVLYYLSHKG